VRCSGSRDIENTLRGHEELVLENLALRQQLTAMKRSTCRARLQPRDRLFWIALTRIWRNWRTAVVLVRPDSVVRWHRDWLRRRSTRRSTPRANGRPRVSQQISRLVREMATANPLWGAPGFMASCAGWGSTSQNGPVMSDNSGGRFRARLCTMRHGSSS
jgi:hypothetical protein